MLEHLRPKKATTVSRPRAKAKAKSKARLEAKPEANAEKKSAKSRDKGIDVVSKKRPTPQQGSDRPSKIRKIQSRCASIETILNKPKGDAKRNENSVDRTLASVQETIDLVSDDEDNWPSIKCLEPKKWSFPNPKAIKHEEPDLSSPSSEYVSNENLKHTIQHEVVKLRADLEQCRAELNQQSECTRRANAEVANLKSNHADEERRQHEENQQIQQAMNRKFAGLQYDNSRLTEDLATVKMERDQLKTVLDNADTVSNALKKELDDLQNKINAEQVRRTTSDALQAENTATLQAENTRLKDDLQKKIEAQSDLLEQLDTINSTSQLSAELAATQIEKLTAENQDLKTRGLLASPAPSNSCDEQNRIDNVKKTYLGVKKKYDSFYSIARNISASTRGMNLGYFGEFGGYVKQLKSAVEEADGHEHEREGERNQEDQNEHTRTE